jgi:hypothetical protein
LIEYHKIGPGQFWEKWSRDEKRYTTTVILRHLKEERDKANRTLAAQAKQEYSEGEFDRVFGYKKGGKLGICRSDGAIASR